MNSKLVIPPTGEPRDATFGDLEAGEVFKGTSGSEFLFMKTDRYDDDAVCLNDGETMDFSPDYKVVRVYFALTPLEKTDADS